MGSQFSSSRFDPIADTVPLEGKVAIVTGANTGIGLATVLHLARKGCTVYLGARSEEKAHAAMRELMRLGLRPGLGQVIYLALDLKDIPGVLEAALKFYSKEERLDLLINNAGISLVDPHIGATGINDVMLTNHFGHYVLTQTLLPLLESTARQPGSDVRIINLSSEAYSFVPESIRFASKEDINNMYEGHALARLKRYGATKLANILYTIELQNYFNERDTPIICITVHPGVVSTEGAHTIRKLPCGVPFYYLTKFFFADIEKGAYTSVYAAASPKVRAEPKKYGGCFMTPVGEVISAPMGAKTKPSRDVGLAQELLATTDRLLSEMDVAVSRLRTGNE